MENLLDNMLEKVGICWKKSWIKCWKFVVYMLENMLDIVLDTGWIIVGFRVRYFVGNMKERWRKYVG